MPSIRLQPKFTLQNKPVPKIYLRVKLSNFFTLEERKFAEFVKQTEDDFLFRKLICPENREEKVISYQRYSYTTLESGFYELKEEIIAERNTAPEIESLIAGKKEIISLCQKIGQEKFSKYFLYNQENLSLPEIAEECQLPLHQIKRIFSLINEVALKSEFYSPSVSSDLGRIVRYRKIATLEKDSAGNLLIAYFSPFYARGKYRIDYEKIYKLKKNNFFSAEELSRLKQLLKDLELINEKKTTIYEVIKKIIEIQKKYLQSANPEERVVCTEKELAKLIVRDTSLVSRAIQNRSLVTPWGEEKSIKYFFPNRKEICKNFVRKIIEEEKEPLTDEKIRNYLKEKFSVSISRRSVNVYRNEISTNHFLS